MLNFSLLGEGKVIVLLHGFLESSRMWDILQLELDFQCLRIDLPGHGNSSVQEEITINQMSQHVMQLTADLEIDSYSVVGHSMGGYVGLELMKNDPKCEKLTLLNSNYWSDDKNKAIDRHRIADFVLNHKKHFIYEAIPHLFLNPKDFPFEVKSLIDEASEMDPKGIAAASRAMSTRRDFTEEIHQWNSRILAIQGKEDAIVPIERFVEEKSKTLIDLVTVDDSAHMSHIEQTKLTRNQIVKFLKK